MSAPLPQGAGRSDRPRLLSYAGRWGRARRWLPGDAQLVLDVGCAFGYGTAALASNGPGGRRVIGSELDPAHLADARRHFSFLPLVRADATALPFRAGGMDAVTILDVIEHVADPTSVLAEVHRVLRPDGRLIVSVPHRGLLMNLDSLNVYPALRRRWPSWPPLEPADEAATGVHRHFGVDEVRQLLGDRFAVEGVARTGLGLAEPFHLAILVVFKALLRWERVYRSLLLVHLLLYLLDDLIPGGPLGYHLTMRATPVRQTARATGSDQAAGRVPAPAGVS
ncbi:MAG: class I SAM-dependent methyltransferase [Acidimicrobiales bacterium]